MADGQGTGIGTAGGADDGAGARREDENRELLERAVRATRERTYWSAFPESPSPRVYGEGAAESGHAAFQAHLGARFALDQPGEVGWVGAERSPYGLDLGVTYPRVDPDVMLPAVRTAAAAWRRATPEQRALVCVEILRRVNARSFELANAVMHTSGQAFVMAFQAGGPHAQDRALEAVAYAYAEQTRTPTTAVWEKLQGKRPPQRVEKTFTPVARGVGLVIGCTTFPTWNSYPGLFASLATGNAVVVKPHPGAILPLAITVRTAREALGEAGFDPDAVTLAAEDPDGRLAADLAVRPEIGIVDFTGSTAFGDWLEAHARQAKVYTEKAGVNTVVLDSTADYDGMLANLAFSLSLYSGQMCTTPQNLLVPRGGIDTDLGHRGVTEVAGDLGRAVDRLLGEDAKAVELLGALVNASVVERAERAEGLGEVVVPSRRVEHPAHPEAVVRTPLVVRLDVSEVDVFGAECFGPVTFLVSTDDTDQSIAVLRDTATARGALTAAVHSTSADVLARTREAALDARVALSENLTADVFVNQSAAYSDFHATGGNPAANATYTDAAFVADRFRVVQSRRPLPPEV